MHRSSRGTKLNSAKDRSRAAVGCLTCLLATGMAMAAVACGGSSSKSTAPPSTPAAGNFNTYLGTQTLSQPLVNGAIQYGGGVWGLTIDDDTSYFTYANTSALAAPDSTNPQTALPFQGNSKNVNGFLKLNLNPAGNGGYAVEIPGRAALLRPGNNTDYPVVSVQTNACPNFTANTVFQFVTLAVSRIGYAPGDSTSYGAYGSLQAGNNGAAWSFSNYSLFAADGTPLNPAQLPGGTCATTKDGYAVSILPTSDTRNVPLTFAAGPSGFFVLDEGQAVLVPSTADPLRSYPLQPTATGPFGLAGVIKPSSPLNTSDVAAAKYAGFKYDTLSATLQALGNSNTATAVTAPVAFGQTVATGTKMTGGEFPNDDVSQVPSSDISIDFGQQDAQNNGLYKSVTVTIPDPQNACVSQPYGGTDANGNPTCTFSGVAVVGNPEGKYAIFLTVYDLRATAFLISPTALEFFLYQQ